MAKRKVTMAVEIDYRNMTDKQLSDVYRLDTLKSEWECTCFDAENDYYVCLQDVEDTTDDRGYAVYLKSTGRLLCLLADAGNALEGYEDSEYGMARSVLYKQIAMLAGWPENMSELKHPYTWLDLLNAIGGMPIAFLKTPAYVWDGSGNRLMGVKDVKPWLYDYNGNIPGPDEDDNCFYIDTLGEE